MTDAQRSLLKILSNTLFDQENFTPIEAEFSEIQSEALQQSVFTLIFHKLEIINKTNCDEKTFLNLIANNINIEYQHCELHRLLTHAKIPYVILKGTASASYYSDSSLRTLGDVDFIVPNEYIDRADALLKSNGFTTDSENPKVHISYARNSCSWELHLKINGIPEGIFGEKIRMLFDDLFEKSRFYEEKYYIPSHFHHGLILLLHTASHLTSEGIGLRHLCDWAAFVSLFSEEEFCLMFENKLKTVGLWKFAQILTALSVIFLGSPPKKFVNQIEYSYLEDLMDDILDGGNFGVKNIKRYQHIKYISNKKYKEATIIHNLIYSLNRKARKKYNFINKYPIFLPLGWVPVIFDYIKAIIFKKSKSDNFNIISDAKFRKNLYDKFELFK